MQQVSGGWGAAEWAAVIAATVTLLGAAVGVWQKWLSDRRQQWWDRTQWALERLSGSEEARLIGLVVLTRLAVSRLATQEDRDMLEAIADVALEDYPGR